jgi:hypothetical protein
MRRERPIQAIVRSTTHLRGKCSKVLGNVTQTSPRSSVMIQPRRGDRSTTRDGPAHVRLNPRFALASITLVNPYFLHARELALNRLKPQVDAFAILQIGGMHRDLEQQTHRVHEQMPFASIDLLN